MRSWQFPACVHLREELDFSEIPPCGRLPIVVHVTAVCHELHQLVQRLIWVVGVKLLPRLSALRRPLSYPGVPLCQVERLGALSY